MLGGERKKGKRRKKLWLGMRNFELLYEVLSKLQDGSENGVFLWLSEVAKHSVFYVKYPVE